MKQALLSVLLLAVACSSNDRPPVRPGPPDSGGAVDAGTDGGTEGDAGTGTDGGTEGDAGTGTDAGTGGDAGTGTDGGLPDAGAGDGGSCVAPGPVSGTVLAEGLNNPRRLAVDATHLYISESHSLSPQQPTPGPGRLLRRARSGGPAVAVATGFRAPDALAVDEDSVYVLDLDGLWRVDKATGVKDERALDTTVNSTTIGGTEVRRGTLAGRDVLVVATAHRRLVRLDTDGGNRQELFTGTGTDQVRSARVVGQEVWFVVTGGNAGLYRVPLDGSRAAELVDGNVAATSLEVTPTHFLVTEGGGGTGQVRRLPRNGGTAEVLAEGLQGPLFPVELNGTVYFKETAAGGTGFLRRVRACAPGTSDAVGPTGTGPGGLLVDLDGNTLVYTSQESGTGGSVGSVP